MKVNIGPALCQGFRKYVKLKNAAGVIYDNWLTIGNITFRWESVG